MTYPAGLYIAEAGKWYCDGIEYDPPSPIGVPGTFKPSALTAGPRYGTPTELYTGPENITVPGTVISNKRIEKKIYIKAADCEVWDCLDVGPTTGTPWTGNTGLINCNDVACVNFKVGFTKFSPAIPSFYLNAIIGHDWTMTNCEAENCVDGAGAYNSNSGATEFAYTYGYSNYIHDFAFFASDPNHAGDSTHPGWTHNDGLQIQGGKIGEWVGNYTIARAGSHPATDYAVLDANGYSGRNRPNGLVVSPNVSRVEQWIIAQNWTLGGESGFSINRAGFATMDFGLVYDNEFEKNSQHGFSGGTSRYPIRYKNGVTIRDALGGTPWDLDYVSNNHDSLGAVYTVGTSSAYGIRRDA